MVWYQRFAADPGDDALHKSDLVTFAMCPRRFRFGKEEDLGRGDGREKKVFGTALAGTAVHATLERALPYVVGGGAVDIAQLRTAYHQEFTKAAAEEGIKPDDVHRAVTWPRERNADLVHHERVAELYYFLLAAPKKVKEVVAVEAKFRGTIDRRGTPIHTEGTLDILFRDHDDRLCLGDYKTGKRRPTQHLLDYGYEANLYAHGLKDGVFVAADGTTKVYGQFPDAIYVVLVQDFMPATKQSRRRVWMKDECKFFDVAPGTLVTVAKGAQRGAGWYRSNCSAEQLPAFAEAVGQVVGCIRMGLFPPVLNTNCSTCRYKQPCVAEGFGVHGSDKKKLEAALAALPEDEIAAATDYGDDE